MNKKCPYCGAELTDSTRIYCDNCGYDVSDSEEHQLNEEKAFIEGYSFNFPYLWHSCIALCVIFFGCIIYFMNEHPLVSFIFGILAILFGAIIPLGLTYYLKNSKKNFGKKKDKK